MKGQTNDDGSGLLRQEEGVSQATLTAYGHWSSQFSDIGQGNGFYSYGDGLQVADMPLWVWGKQVMPSKYTLGYHFYTDLPFDVKPPIALIKCYVHKSWIMSMGGAYTDDCPSKLVLVSPFAVFPKYPETEVKLSDILAELEKQKVKAVGIALEDIPKDGCGWIQPYNFLAGRCTDGYIIDDPMPPEGDDQK